MGRRRATARRCIDHREAEGIARWILWPASNPAASIRLIRRMHCSRIPSSASPSPRRTCFLRKGERLHCWLEATAAPSRRLTIHVPANRLHLVTVDANGRAHLKLRPRFELNAEQRVVKIDALPAYDVPPTVDDLFREAGRNHQLEHAFHAERSTARRAQREADQQRREEVAGSFLADPTQRAMRRPSPSPQRCYRRHTGRSPAVRCPPGSGEPRVWCRPKPIADGERTFGRARNGDSARRRRRSPHMRTRSRSSPTGSRSTVRRSSRRDTPPACSQLRRSSRR